MDEWDANWKSEKKMIRTSCIIFHYDSDVQMELNKQTNKQTRSHRNPYIDCVDVFFSGALLSSCLPKDSQRRQGEIKCREWATK